MSSPQPRLVFNPASCDQQSPRLQDAQGHTTWTPLISCPAQFPIEHFADAGQQLVDHPEYNSTLILRSETLAESFPDDGEVPHTIPRLRGAVVLKFTHRRLLPRRPGRDGSIDQHCTIYAADGHCEPSILVLTPLFDRSGSLPYFHPQVFHIAFRYIPSPASDPGDGANPDSSARIQVEVVAFPGVPIDPNSRIYRTCLALLEALHRYGWGAVTNYKKRVNHDCIIPRDEYQDLYLVMRERHKHLVGSWQEATDPLKHVFEDIGIATFLILLWRRTFSTDHCPRAPIGTNDPPTRVQKSYEIEDENDVPQWFSWPRPPGGFIDLGCGNGLLVHILLSEGYQGFGIDIRARASWSHYPPTTQRHLHVKALDPMLNFGDANLATIVSDLTMAGTPPSIGPEPDPSSHLQRGQREESDEIPSKWHIPDGVFIIGNHADELTPYIPILSVLYQASGYLNIPCCPWDLDQKFNRTNSTQYPLPSSHDNEGAGSGGDIFATAEAGHVPENDDRWIESLNLGGNGKFTSSYSAYRIWLARLTAWCGWEIETEVLRIPSTRNWALVGRRKSLPEDVSRQRAGEILTKVRERGVFMVRQPEGKRPDH